MSSTGPEIIQKLIAALGLPEGSTICELVAKDALTGFDPIINPSDRTQLRAYLRDDGSNPVSQEEHRKYEVELVNEGTAVALLGLLVPDSESGLGTLETEHHIAI